MASWSNWVDTYVFDFPTSALKIKVLRYIYPRTHSVDQVLITLFSEEHSDIGLRFLSFKTIKTPQGYKSYPSGHLVSKGRRIGVEAT